MKTAEQIRKEMRETPAGQLLARMGCDYYDTESSARRVAEHAAEEIAGLLEVLKAEEAWRSTTGEESEELRVEANRLRVATLTKYNL